MSRPVSKPAPRVAFLVETSNAYARALLRGMVGYIREHRPWSIYLAEHGRGDRPPAWLKGWDGDGIIARIENEEIARALKKVDVPMVDVSAARLLPELPWFETDDAAIARIVFDHLSERGFRHFAFCGDPRFNWSVWRGGHFVRTVTEAGYDCATYKPQRLAADDEQVVSDIGAWLETLPKPIGVMACYDLRGQQILDACRRRGIAVPDEVAVVGVDNDELLCALSDPPLSSVIPNASKTGYDAAALLDRMMRGERFPPDAHFIPPLGVAARQSSDVLAIEDRQIVAAVRYIRAHAVEGIAAKDVLKLAPGSRRQFETKFKKLIGRTPHEEVTRVRINRVKELLCGTDLTLEAIAERTGFKHAEYLSVAFKRETGISPGRFRGQSGG